jgi:hypothetical protein
MPKLKGTTIKEFISLNMVVSLDKGIGLGLWQCLAFDLFGSLGSVNGSILGKEGRDHSHFSLGAYLEEVNSLDKETSLVVDCSKLI